MLRYQSCQGSLSNYDGNAARAFYIFVHFLAVLCKTARWKDKIQSFAENVNTRRWIPLSLSELEHRPYTWIQLLNSSSTLYKLQSSFKKVKLNFQRVVFVGFAVVVTLGSVQTWHEHQLLVPEYTFGHPAQALALEVVLRHRARARALAWTGFPYCPLYWLYYKLFGRTNSKLVDNFSIVLTFS